MIDYRFITIELAEALGNFGFDCVCDADKKEIDLLRTR